ncbi:hypothetical protein CLAIMM_03127 isoform 4 [Cladophialophora immunda]|nr:hypothetical protein CLAIMM_03127 isoform 4 [Cladophialophora immunda]
MLLLGKESRRSKKRGFRSRHLMVWSSANYTPLMTRQASRALGKDIFNISQRVRDTLENFFEWSGLGFYKAFGSDSNRTFSFMNKTDTEAQVLVVQLWSTGSRVVFYNGSHLQYLSAKPAANGLLEIPPSHLTRKDIKPVEVKMEHGGL